MTKKLLFVCLGNICRSPAAEGVFLHLIAGARPVRPVRRRLRRYRQLACGQSRPIDGCVPQPNGAAFTYPSRARQIELSDLEEFDLVLTMDSDNFAQRRSLAKEAGNNATAEIRPMLSYASSLRRNGCTGSLLRR